MPLSDFVRYLNAQQEASGSGLRSTTAFVSQDGRVLVNFSNLRLESYYSPIIDVASGELCGHAAGLHAFGLINNQLLEPEAVFVLPSDNDEFIYLDRMVRTLHALNYLTYQNRHSRGTLLLRVHPRHVASVAVDHGLAFEEVLRACGLLPRQITLEIEIDGVEDAAHLVSAVANYKSRGYGIAVGRFGRREINFSLLREISPAIVKFDPLLLLSSTRPLGSMVDRLHDFGARVMVEGLDSAALRKDAQANGFDLLQVLPPPHAPE
ncbi:EAL domain-containing protein [Propionivibrio sp.]|uniref:EAL domain-containing protein n=1 Tax=Propionivibrio sp. TaxID=2212460 RepID=UPI00262D62CD|nr:EAL domain-containing protein [Propionivibrio sp.]